MNMKAPKGTKDIMPKESGQWQYIESQFDEICRLYGFRELRTPMFESTELFQRGVGDTTDIVQKEMYTFEDLGHRSITLKPEGTSPAVRAFIESREYAEMQPTKYYYDTPCFRYEKPQAGRLREFHQFGVENFGTPSMTADAEVIALAADFLERMGLKDVELHINSVGCRECRAVYRKALQDFLRPHYEDLCDTCKTRFEKNPMRILDCKSPADQEIVKDAPVMLDYLCDDCREAFEELQQALKAMKIDFTIDPRIVRGLDYYTKTAFEFVSTAIGAQGTICGGGRYDHLIEEVGGPSMPGVGFGLGKERLLLLMNQEGAFTGEEHRVELAVSYIGDEAKLYALGLAADLRKEGLAVSIDTLDRNLKGQMKYANKLGAAYTVVIGEDEMKSGMITLKNMDTSEQKMIHRDEIAKEIRK